MASCSAKDEKQSKIPRLCGGKRSVEVLCGDKLYALYRWMVIEGSWFFSVLPVNCFVSTINCSMPMYTVCCARFLSLFLSNKHFAAGQGFAEPLQSGHLVLRPWLNILSLYAIRFNC
ncbi:hypothetical protein V6N13_134791 [Hibiscus sabdariffa]